MVRLETLIDWALCFNGTDTKKNEQSARREESGGIVLTGNRSNEHMNVVVINEITVQNLFHKASMLLVKFARVLLV